MGQGILDLGWVVETEKLPHLDQKRMSPNSSTQLLDPFVFLSLLVNICFYFFVKCGIFGLDGIGLIWVMQMDKHYEGHAFNFGKGTGGVIKSTRL